MSQNYLHKVLDSFVDLFTDYNNGIGALVIAVPLIHVIDFERESALCLSRPY